ncbi:chromosome segregation ATPase [Streptomyces sp. LN325]|uniref:chromosome segregation ATPase n=1 Tax=Streptomyces sp. LN325 TaxID=3112976 RepID=UPI00371E16E5
MANNGPSEKRSSGQAMSEARPKWVPMRDDQYSGLTDLARDLMNARTRKTERLTENTLIRVGIDLVLAHPELLAGDTESELRANALAYIERLQARPEPGDREGKEG